MARSWPAASLLGLLAVQLCLQEARAAAGIDPAYARNITVYHINPVIAGSLPIDQDTGDVGGDLYWYLGQFLLPEECKNLTKAKIAGFDCDNTERTGKLVATQVTLEVDERFTVYSACNLCNGTDPFSGRPCRKGEYICDCMSDSRGPGACDPHRVGRESVLERFGPPPTTPKCQKALDTLCSQQRNSTKGCYSCIAMHRFPLKMAGCTMKDNYYYCPNFFGVCSEYGPDWECWRENIVRKTGGYWYSTRKSAMCNATEVATKSGSCAWRAVASRTIREPCLRERLIRVVESADKPCFKACGPRNESSPCWIGCFFDTVLGPDARNDSRRPLAGLPFKTLQEGWEKAFRKEELGGCPSVDMEDADLAVAHELGLSKAVGQALGAMSSDAPMVFV